VNILSAGIAFCHGKGKRAIYQSNGILARISKIFLPKAVSCFLLKEDKKN